MDNVLLYGGLGTGAIACICFLGFRSRESLIRKIEDAPVLQLGPELVSKLQSLEEKIIPYGVINGNMYPVDEHITGNHDPSVSALIQKVTIKEHKAEWSSTSRMWNDQVRTISNTTKDVAIKCVQLDESGNQGVAYIQEPLLAESLNLSVVHDKFEPVQSSATESLVQWASGEKTKGFQIIEEVLPTGTALTGIGEVALEENKVHLRPPQGTLKYILSSLPLNGIIRDQKSSSGFIKAVAIVLGFGSSIMLLIWLYRWWKKYREQARNREIFHAGMDNVENVNVGVEEGTHCIVCFDNPRNVVLLHCGHICVCRECANRLQDCPVCRSPVDRVILTYNS